MPSQVFPPLTITGGYGSSVAPVDEWPPGGGGSGERIQSTNIAASGTVSGEVTFDVSASAGFGCVAFVMHHTGNASGGWSVSAQLEVAGTPVGSAVVRARAGSSGQYRTSIFQFPFTSSDEVEADPDAVSVSWTATNLHTSNQQHLIDSIQLVVSPVDPQPTIAGIDWAKVHAAYDLTQCATTYLADGDPILMVPDLKGSSHLVTTNSGVTYDDDGTPSKTAVFTTGWMGTTLEITSGLTDSWEVHVTVTPATLPTGDSDSKVLVSTHGNMALGNNATGVPGYKLVVALASREDLTGVGWIRFVGSVESEANHIRSNDTPATSTAYVLLARNRASGNEGLYRTAGPGQLVAGDIIIDEDAADTTNQRWSVGIARREDGTRQWDGRWAGSWFLDHSLTESEAITYANKIGALHGLVSVTETVVSPATVALAAALPAAAPLTAGAGTTGPATITATASLPTPTVVAGGSVTVAPATITVTAAMGTPAAGPPSTDVAPTYSVKIDWDGDGDFESGTEDVTELVLHGFYIERGKDQARPSSPAMAPTCRFTLDNADGRFWPDNTSGPIGAEVAHPAHQVQVQATWGGVTYTLFTGVVVNWALDYHGAIVEVEALGGVYTLGAFLLDTGVYSGIRTGEAINIILNEIGWSPDARLIDTGASVLPWWWERNGGVIEAFHRVVSCEGPPARVDINPDGEFVFEDRHHRIVDAHVSAVTLSDVTEPAVTIPFLPVLDWASIVNDITIPVQRLEWTDLQVVAEWTGTEEIPEAPATVDVTVEFDTPVLDPTVTSQTINGVPQASGLEVTGAVMSATFGFSRVPLEPAETLTRFTVTARALEVVEQQDVTDVDAASFARYGSRSIPGSLDAPFLSEYDADAIAAAWIDWYSQPLQQLAVTLDGLVATRTAQKLQRDVSDRVTVDATAAYINAEHFIDQVRHSVTEQGQWHETTFGLERAPTVTVTGPLMFILDDTTKGRLDTGGRLAI